MNYDDAKDLVDNMVEAYTEYRTMNRSIHYTDGDRAWSELERRREKWINASRLLAEHVLLIEEEETRVPY
jgi:hypothetical protein